MDRAVLLHHVLGAVSVEGNLEGAVQFLQKRVAAEPAVSKYRLLLAEALLLLRPDEAIPHFYRAIEAGPQEPHAYWHLATLLMLMGDRGEALRVCEMGLLHYPDNLDILSKTSYLGRHEEFIEYALKRLESNPSDAKLWSRLAILFRELGRLPEAQVCSRRECALDPKSNAAHLNLALALLLAGEFEEGFREYEGRWGVVGKYSCPIPALAPWDGAPLTGKSILLWAEQGIGDTIQFVRYARIAASLGASVTVHVPQSLVRLMSWMPDVPRIATEDTVADNQYDCHCPLLTMPLRCQTRPDSIPAPATIVIPVEFRQKWAQSLSRFPGKKIGLAWAGNPFHQNDRCRSASLAEFRPLLDRPGLQFFSLQIGAPSSQIQDAGLGSRIIDLRTEAEGLAETAAAISQMDLVITIDSALGHLAGSIGVPTWVLLTSNPDWRWMLKRSDSPWYPSVRLFRQQALHEGWKNVMAEMAQALSNVFPAETVACGSALCHQS